MSPVVHATIPIDDLVRPLMSVLNEDLVGLYVLGSAVTGDFDEGVSDIDLVAVTARPADRLDLIALDGARRAFVAAHPDWDDRVEIVFIGRDTLQEFRTSAADLAVVSPGEALHLSGPAADWLQNWYLTRASGVTLSGEPVTDVVPEISRDEYLGAVAAYALWLASRDLEAMRPNSLAYTVISLCRALRTLRTGHPCSKRAGAAWVAAAEPAWAAVIDEALACRLARGATGFGHTDSRERAVVVARALSVALIAARLEGEDAAGAE